MDELEELQDGGQKLWAKMTKAKCRYCKHFDNDRHAERDGYAGDYIFVLSANGYKGESLSLFCDQRSWLFLEALKAQECPKYEWDSQLTKYDFEEIA